MYVGVCVESVWVVCGLCECLWCLCGVVCGVCEVSVWWCVCGMVCVVCVVCVV